MPIISLLLTQVNVIDEGQSFFAQTVRTLWRVRFYGRRIIRVHDVWGWYRGKRARIMMCDVVFSLEHDDGFRIHSRRDRGSGR
jgi:hypothetical protein